MKSGSIKKLLRLLGAKVPDEQNRSGWILSTCPFAPWTHQGGTSNSPTFGVEDKPGRKRYHCFSCGERGFDVKALPTEVMMHQLQEHYAGLKIAEAIALVEAEDEVCEVEAKSYDEVEAEKNKPMVVFPEWWLDSFIPVQESQDAINYLAGRQITEEVCEFLDLRYDSERRRVCFPVRDTEGILRAFHGRAIDKDNDLRYFAYGFHKKRNPLIWLGEEWMDVDKPVLIVESVFDLASALRVYSNTICPLMSGLSQAKCDRVSDVEEGVTLFDFGTGGDHGRTGVTKFMKGSLIRHITPSEEDDDPGNMSVDRLKEVLSDHLTLDK